MITGQPMPEVSIFGMETVTVLGKQRLLLILAALPVHLATGWVDKVLTKARTSPTSPGME